MITNAGGLGILCADACESAGLELPELTEQTRLALATIVPGEASLRNPIDLLGSATAATYDAVVPHVLADPNVDALIVIFVPPVVAGADEVAAAIRRAVEPTDRDKPVVAVVISAEGTPGVLSEPGSPVVALPYPESAARALAFACERADWLERAPGATPELDVDSATGRRVVDSQLAESPDSWLPPHQIRALLEAYGIPLVAERVVHSADDAETAAREVGFPAVVKTAVPGVHKSDIGGVALDLRDAAQVRAAAETIGLPVIVQPFLADGTELLAGALQDPVFGPLVAFGPGGANAELIGQAGFRIAPLTVLDAQELVLEGKAGRLVAGFRGEAPADAGALVDLLLRLARLVEDIPEVAELDLNPILARPDGCVAVDARVRIAATHPEPRVKSW